MGLPPLVSVVLPTYNRATCLRSAIDSVRDQSYQNWELLIVDDRSTDGTAALAASFGKLDPRIRYLKNDRSRGAGGARNRGIEEAGGEFVAFLDSDDRWYPQHLERTLAHFEAHPEVSLVGSEHWRINRLTGERKTTTGYLLGMIEVWEKDPIARRAIRADDIRKDIRCISDRDHIISFLIGGFLWLQTSTVVIRRRVFDKIGTFNERLVRYEDYEFWLRINGSFRIGFQPEPQGEFDITGLDEMEGDRYATYERERVSPTIDRLFYNLSLLRGLSSLRLRRRFGYGDELSADQKRFLWDRLRNLHRKIAFYYQQTDKRRAALHHLRAARYRPKDVVYFLHMPRHFLTHPY